MYSHSYDTLARAALSTQPRHRDRHG
eukprot:SAG31_NODE_20327_length_577_cov_1.433054_1_plen_25_part_10